MRKRTATLLVAGLAAALTAVSWPGTAQGAPDTPADSSDATVAWDGISDQIIQVQDELFGRITVAPGAHDQRSVSVRNNGSSDAILTVAIVNATGVPEGLDRGDDTFFEEMLVNGFPAADLERAETVVATVPLARGQATQVPFAVDFPSEADCGNAAKVGEREFAFDVRLTLTGDTADPTPTPTPTPTSGGTVAGSGTGTRTTASGTGAVVRTGGVLASTDGRLIAAAAGLAALAALVGGPVLARRRTRGSR